VSEHTCQWVYRYCGDRDMVGEFRSVYGTVFFTSRKIPLTDVQSPSLALLAGKLEALPPDLRYQAEPGNE